MLEGLRVLVVEDDYAIASDLSLSLEELGVTVVGPAGSVADALALVAREPAIDAAVLDIHLGAEKVFPVADTLQTRGVPFVFATGYDDWVIPDHFRSARRIEKPLDVKALARVLSRAHSGR